MQIKLTTFVFFICLQSLFYSQDVITKKDGTDIDAKIIEITINEVKYKKFSNLQGPSYTISKNEILMIRYENGEKEIFDSNTSSVSNTVISESNSNKTKEEKQAKFGMYIEGLGNAFWGSFNFEAIVLNNPKLKLATRLGIGLTPDLEAYIYGIDSSSSLYSWESFPIGVNSILFEGNHHLELGVGGLIYPMGYFSGFNPNMNVSYRYQKPSKGFFLSWNNI